LPRQDSEPLSVVDDPPPSVQIESGWLPAQLELRSTNVDHWFPSAPPPLRPRATLPCSAAPV